MFFNLSEFWPLYVQVFPLDQFFLRVIVSPLWAIVDRSELCEWGFSHFLGTCRFARQTLYVLSQQGFQIYHVVEQLLSQVR